MGKGKVWVEASFVLSGSRFDVTGEFDSESMAMEAGVVRRNGTILHRKVLSELLGLPDFRAAMFQAIENEADRQWTLREHEATRAVRDLAEYECSVRTMTALALRKLFADLDANVLAQDEPLPVIMARGLRDIADGLDAQGASALDVLGGEQCR